MSSLGTSATLSAARITTAFGAIAEVRPRELLTDIGNGSVKPYSLFGALQQSSAHREIIYLFARRKLPLASAAVLSAALLVGSGAVKLAHAQAANPGTSEPPPRGKKLAETYCASCHGVDGNSTDPQLRRGAAR